MKIADVFFRRPMSVRAMNVAARFFRVPASDRFGEFDVSAEELRRVTIEKLLDVKNCGIKTANEIMARIVEIRQQDSDLKVEVMEAISQFC